VIHEISGLEHQPREKRSGCRGFSVSQCCADVGNAALQLPG
jgi:hypothetical protein